MKEQDYIGNTVQPQSLARVDAGAASSAEETPLQQSEAPQLDYRNQQIALSRRELKEEFGVELISVGTQEPQVFHVLWDGVPYFVAKEFVTAQQLRDNGICRTADLTGGRFSINCNYAAYLKQNYDVHVMSIISDTEISWVAYHGNDGLIAHTSLLAELQSMVEKRNFPRVHYISPSHMTITSMPDGHVSITFPDATEVIMDRSYNINFWRDHHGRSFRKMQGKSVEWRADGDIVGISPRFELGCFSFGIRALDAGPARAAG